MTNILTHLLDPVGFQASFIQDPVLALLESATGAAVHFHAWHAALAGQHRPDDEAHLAILHRIVPKLLATELLEPYPWNPGNDIYRSTPKGRIAALDRTHLAYVRGLQFVVDCSRASVFMLHLPGTAGNGTGFLVTQDYVATAAHVVRGLDEAFVVEDERGTRWPQDAIHIHPQFDIALVHLKSPHPARPFKLQPFPLGLLEEVVMMGFPPIPCNTRTTLVTNRGEIAGRVDVRGKQDGYVVSCIARGGSSGAPVVGTDGLVAGLISQTLFAHIQDHEMQPSSETLGYTHAIPAVLVLSFLNDTFDPNRPKPIPLNPARIADCFDHDSPGDPDRP